MYNYNYYPQQNQQQISQQPQNQYLRTPLSVGLKGRPVSSLEEARASSIDFDGSIFYFPDIANKRIYTKQINLDGTATLNMYELKEIPSENPAMLSNNYITREEFEMVITQLRNAMMPATQPAESASPQKQEVMSF